MVYRSSPQICLAQILRNGHVINQFGKMSPIDIVLCVWLLDTMVVYCNKKRQIKFTKMSI